MAGRTYRVLSSGDVAVGNVSQQSGAAPQSAHAVRLVSTTNCRVKIGTEPEAGANDALLIAHREYVFQASEGEKVAAVRDTADGVLNVCWLI